MPSDRLRIGVMTAAIVLVLTGVVAASVLIGIRIGRDAAIRTVSGVLEGSVPAEELQKQKLVAPGKKPSYFAQGTIVERGDRHLVLEDGSGSERRVQFTPKTKVRVGKHPGKLANLETGSTVFAVGQPLADGSLRANAVRVKR